MDVLKAFMPKVFLWQFLVDWTHAQDHGEMFVTAQRALATAVRNLASALSPLSTPTPPMVATRPVTQIAPVQSNSHIACGEVGQVNIFIDLAAPSRDQAMAGAEVHIGVKEKRGEEKRRFKFGKAVENNNKIRETKGMRG